MQTVYIVAAGLGFGLLVLVLESWILARARSRIPIRVLVTGTRGKSSVVRLIHHALIQNGLTAVGKTTGSAARFLPPEAREQPIRRHGRVSILEQRGVLLQAARLSSQALVIEAMAVDPEVAEAETALIIRPTHVVVTNARVDHVDAAGGTVASVAEALACSIPANVPVYIPESELAGDAGAVFRSTGGRIVAVAQPEEQLLDSDVASPIFGGNAALASRVCEDLGVSREDIMRTFRAAPPDPGALRIHYAQPSDTVIVNAFAANDPLSTEMTLRASYARHPEIASRQVVIAMNIRSDRADRTQLWLNYLKDSPFWTMNSIIVLGDHAQSVAVARILKREVCVPVYYPRFRKAAKVSEFLLSVANHGLMLCIGNLAGMGERLTCHWSEVYQIYG
jgi:gamma-polyglutamate synthase